MRTFIFIGLAILTGVILSVSWPCIGDMEWLIFVAFLPLLAAEHEISRSVNKYVGLKVFGLAYLAFLIFNVGTTWWIKLASEGGMVMAVAFNSVFMATVFLLFHLTKRHINEKVGYAALIIYWLGFEWLHINWELSWIWLTLGNVFANKIEWIQWYEYTGTLGGSLWILVVNVLAFRVHLHMRFGYRGITGQILHLLFVFFLIMLPILWSGVIFSNYIEKEDPVEVIVVQPNIDPYKDKFEGMHENEQIDRLIRLSGERITPKTELIFGPETAFPMGYWEHEIEYIYGTEQVRDLIEFFPHVKYIVGLSTIRLYAEGEPLSPTARPFKDGSGNYYDYYNAVMQVDSSDHLQIYRKSKLVLGVEKMPFTGKFSLLEKLSIKLGGASGSLGTEKEPVLFTSKTRDGREIKVIPAICYESIYSDYLSQFVLMGGNLLGIVTNDGWWGSTPGYEQHLAYAQLRAIEFRRSVARSANTGISALINQKGEIKKKTVWWTQDALRGTLNLNSELTVYAKYGDYLGRISAFFSILLVLWLIVSRIRKKSSLGQFSL